MAIAEKPLAYVAASFVKMPEAKRLAAICERCGYGVVSSWLRENPANTFEDITTEDAAAQALRDIEEVAVADVFVLLSERGQAFKGGGRLVEMGIALECEIPIIVYGLAENIFHHLPQVELANCDEDLESLLLDIKDGLDG